jgi:hypothetical protein
MKDKSIAMYELEKHKIKYKDNKEDASPWTQWQSLVMAIVGHGPLS